MVGRLDHGVDLLSYVLHARARSRFLMEAAAKNLTPIFAARCLGTDPAPKPTPEKRKMCCYLGAIPIFKCEDCPHR